MFLNHKDHAAWLFDCVKEKPKHVFIASFGIYAGISYAGQDTTKWGNKFRLATRDIMEEMRNIPDVRFLIGVANYRSCKNNIICIDCEKQYCRSLIRLVHHTELFPEFKWRITTNLHLKTSIFFYEKDVKGIAGGRNFSDSDWADCTIELEKSHIKDLYKHVNEIWNNSMVLNDDSIGKIFEQQEISERGFQAVVANIDEDDEDMSSKPPF